MNKNKKAVLNTDNTTVKNYAYFQGACTLKFSLRNDIKQEMKDFLALLDAAKKEVESDLAKL